VGEASRTRYGGCVECGMCYADYRFEPERASRGLTRRRRLRIRAVPVPEMEPPVTRDSYKELGQRPTGGQRDNGRREYRLDPSLTER